MTSVSSQISSLCLTADCLFAGSETYVKEIINPPSESSSHKLQIQFSVDDKKANNVQNDDHPSSGDKINIRDYQLELAQKALDNKNCIICAPTGSGKTYVAGQVLKTMYENRTSCGLRFKAVFLVCQRILVDQQMVALKNFLKFTSITSSDTEAPVIEAPKVGKDCDNVPLSIVFENYDVIVMTGQILMNAIKCNDISISYLDVIIFDECHHTDLKHVYNAIMLSYLELKFENIDDDQLLAKNELPKDLPQIIGITATLGVGNCVEETEIIGHYIKMCANLDCMSIEYVRKNVDELAAHSPKPIDEKIITCLPKSRCDPFGMKLEEIIHEIEKLAFPEFQPTFDIGTQRYENQAVNLKKQSESSKLYLGFIAEVLISMNQAYMLFLDFSAQDSFDFICDYFNDETTFHDDIDNLREAIQELWRKDETELNNLAIKERNDDNPKLRELAKLLMSMFTMNPDARGILLTRTKKSVDIFLKFFSLNDQLMHVCKPAKLVGHSVMTDAEQTNAIKRFTDGSNNLFVATDVAQEGLDLPACNFVVRYNFVSNEIGSVQARGRARALASECSLIIDSSSPDLLRELRNRNMEELMGVSLRAMDALEVGERIKMIRDVQVILFRKYRQSKLKLLEWNKKDGANVEIVCKNCKQFLCRGNEIKKKKVPTATLR